MAGEVEELFRIDFQGDFSLSGSISFGRYENESLSWERRSSFSHNRYLEEVEKCSKPGSVSEKKAYFEAHFKKKGGLLGQNSLESHNGLVDHTMENDASEKGSDFEIVNKENHNGHFDDHSDNPESWGDKDMTEFETANPGVPFTDPKFGDSFSSDGFSMDGFHKDVNADIEEQGDSAENKLPNFVGDRAQIEINQNINNIASGENISPEVMDSSPKSELVKRAGKSSSGSQQTLSVKMTSKRETKASKSQVNIRQIQRNISGDAFKSPEMVSNKSKGEPPHIICTEEHSSKTAALSTHAVGRKPKIVDSKVLKGKSIFESGSGEKGRTSRVSYSSPLKLESKSYQKTTRHNQTVNSAMQETRSSASASNFRSIELAERRKQGKAEAGTKRLQKNLDIKSKTVPTSYCAVRPESKGKKAIFSSTKVRNTSRNSAAGGLGKYTDSSTSEGLNTSKHMNCQKAVNVEASTNSPIPSAYQQVLPEAVSETENTGKKDKLKEKDSTVQKSRGSESCGASKRQGVEGKQKVGAQRSMNVMGRKDIKCVSGSGMGRLAVGVTS